MARRRRQLNPIAEKFKRLVDMGKTTYEAMCVASDLKYFTFMNIMARPIITPLTLKSILLARLITKQELADYKQWLFDNGYIGRGHASKKYKSVESEREEQDSGNEEHDETGSQDEFGTTDF